MIIASFQDYLPLDDFWRIVLVCLGVAIVSPAAAAVAIRGFEANSTSRARGGSGTLGTLQIGLGTGLIVVLIVLGILAMISD